MNVCTITGRLGRDAELRNTRTGDAVLNFSVANDIGYGQQKTTQWVRCVLWGKRGEALCDFLRKGTLVAVSGSVSLSEYTSQAGQKSASLEIRVNEVTLLGSKDSDGDRGGRSDRQAERGGQQQRQQRQSGWDAPKGPGDLDDDIPF